MKVLVYPRDWNPYQEMLYSPMRTRHGVTIAYAKIYPIIGTSAFFVLSMLRRMQGYRLVHIHWQAFYLTINVPYAKQLSYWNSRFWFWWLNLLGYNVVWTVHNIVPHAPQTSNDLEVTRRLMKLASKTIIHSPYTAMQMEEMDLDTVKTAVIPHGNYIGMYPDGITRHQARKKFGLKNTDTVLLFFGNVSIRKGVHELLKTYAALRNEAPSLKLVVAGLCNDEILHHELLQMYERGEIILFDGRVDDDQVAAYFKACDVVCLPFKSVTTSGSALLALTFGKAVIAPRQGALQDFSDKIGFFYNPKQPDALAESIRLSVDNKKTLERKGAAAYDYAKTLSWDVIADKTYAIYQDVLDPKGISS